MLEFTIPMCGEWNSFTLCELRSSLTCLVVTCPSCKVSAQLGPQLGHLSDRLLNHQRISIRLTQAFSAHSNRVQGLRLPAG